MGGKPKHEALSDWIRDRILAGTFPIGSRLPSENELAQRFRLSRQTVRQALSTLVRENLLERRQGSGTYVSRTALDNRPVTMNIGVITTYLDSYIFPGVIRGIDRVLSQGGYHMQLGITYNKTRNENQVLSSLLGFAQPQPAPVSGNCRQPDPPAVFKRLLRRHGLSLCGHERL